MSDAVLDDSDGQVEGGVREIRMVRGVQQGQEVVADDVKLSHARCSTSR
jgi:hypothetical protein